MDKLPKGWKQVTIDDIASKVVDGSHNPPKDKGEGIPMISAQNVINGEINLNASRYISEEEFKNEQKRTNIQVGDIFLTIVGTIGRCAVVRNIDVKFAIQRSIAIIRTSENSFYLCYYFQSPQFIELLTSNARGAAQQGIYLGQLKSLQVPLPPLPDQTRIVSKLDALFTRIDKSITLLEENIKHTKGLMASVLEELFEKLRSKSTIYKIKEIAEIKGGKRLPKGESIQDEKTDYPYIRVTDFTNDGTIDVNSVKYMTQSVHQQIKRYIITSKDLYISIAGTIGKTGIIPKELENANLTENAARLVFKSNLKINNRFVYYFTLSDNFKDQVGLATKVVAQPKLALTRLSEVELPIPSIEIQNKEVKIFDELSRKFQEINTKQLSKLAYLQALKSSILDRAFKGEL